MSEEYVTESSAEEDGGAADFSGSLKTALYWDPSNKHLGVKLRQSAENGRRLAFKWKGQLNTTTGMQSYTGHLRKNFYTDSPITMTRVMVAAEEARQGARPSDPDLDPNRFLPAGLKSMFLKDWILSPGLCFNSDQQHKIKYALTVTKAPQFLTHSPKLDCWLTGKASCLIDPKTAKVSAVASLRMKLLRYNVTSKQDLRVSLGLDATGSSLKSWTQAPYMTIAENNLSLKLQHNQLSLLYTL